MDDTVHIPSLHAVMGRMADAVSTADTVQENYEERAAREPEDSGAGLTADTLRDVKHEINDLISALKSNLGEDTDGPGPERTYRGARSGNENAVTVSWHDGGGRLQAQALDPRLDLWNHSPTGMEWGYLGSGPAQLALAILADATQDSAYAKTQHQPFKQDVISRIRGNSWTIHGEDVAGWVLDHPADPGRMERAREWEEMRDGRDPENPSQGNPDAGDGTERAPSKRDPREHG